MTPEELGEIGAGSPSPAARRPSPDWRRWGRSRNLWLLCAMYSGYTYGLYFYLTWLPTYLREQRGMSWLGVGAGAALPFLVGAAANLAGGCWTDRLVRRFGLRWGRRLPAISGLLGAALFLALAALTPSAGLSLFCLALSFGCADLILAICWATCIDLGRENAGAVAGVMNSLGQAGGMFSPYLLGWLVDRRGSWTLPLLISAGYYALSGGLWLCIDPERSLEERDPVDARRTRPLAAR